MSDRSDNFLKTCFSSFMAERYAGKLLFIMCLCYKSGHYTMKLLILKLYLNFEYEAILLSL